MGIKLSFPTAEAVGCLGAVHLRLVANTADGEAEMHVVGKRTNICPIRGETESQDKTALEKCESGKQQETHGILFWAKIKAYE